MTTPAYLRHHILPAAYALLPENMRRTDATAMLMAIALQESRCEHRCQVNGPAKSFWQFELGGVTGVATHRASAPYLRLACSTLRVTPMPTAIHAALEHNDVLAAVAARLLLWTLPHALPEKHEPNEAWEQYRAAWRPGKPHRSTWDACYAAGWALAES